MMYRMMVVSVPVQPETKILLDALSTLMQSSTGRVIDVLTSAYVEALPTEEAKVINGLKRAALTRLTAGAPVLSTGRSAPVASYQFSRLCFKRDLIEPLAPNDEFRVETPIGTFQMTKADFRRVFPNVIQSRSYSEAGLYHYRTLPSQAEQFRVA
jgi:hypothetical protein